MMRVTSPWVKGQNTGPVWVMPWKAWNLFRNCIFRLIQKYIKERTRKKKNGVWFSGFSHTGYPGAGLETSYSILWPLSYDPKNNYPKQIIRRCALHRSFLSLKLSINFKINEASQSDKKYTQENAVLCLGTQSFPTLCNHMDCSLPGASVPGNSPGRNTGVVAVPSSRRSSQPRDQTEVCCIAGRFFTSRPIQENILLQK